MTVYTICSVCKEVNDPKDMKRIKKEWVCKECQKKG